MSDSDSTQKRPAVTHPAIREILRNFRYKHLPPHLQDVSRPFCELAHDMAARFPNGGAELTVCLRKLMEAKDCGVRVALPPADDDDSVLPKLTDEEVAVVRATLRNRPPER